MKVEISKAIFAKTMRFITECSECPFNFCGDVKRCEEVWLDYIKSRQNLFLEFIFVDIKQ